MSLAIVTYLRLFDALWVWVWVWVWVGARLTMEAGLRFVYSKPIFFPTHWLQTFLPSACTRGLCKGKLKGMGHVFSSFVLFVLFFSLFFFLALPQ